MDSREKEKKECERSNSKKTWKKDVCVQLGLVTIGSKIGGRSQIIEEFGHVFIHPDFWTLLCGSHYVNAGFIIMVKKRSRVYPHSACILGRKTNG